MMMKIQRITPPSFTLMDLANAGVAIRTIHPIINPANQGFLPLNILHSPFLLGAVFNYCISYANAKLKNKVDLFI
jgi:hypothetical protein